MSDLKDKAEAAIAEVAEWMATGEHWPQWNRRYLDFRSKATPEAVIALLDENESLRDLLSRARVYMDPSDPLRNLINATLISSPENH